MIHRFCADFAKCPAEGRRLIIWGKNGSGKTHCAKAIYDWAHSVAVLLPYVVTRHGEVDLHVETNMFMRWPAIVDGFKDGLWHCVEESGEQTLLVIDDVGAEHDPSGIAKEKLCYILERRAQKWTVITTNVPPEQWETRFEQRIASRFLRNCEILDFSDVPDFNAAL